MEHITLPNLFFQKALENSDKPFLWAKRNKEWKSLSWHETEIKVKQVAAGLKYHGIMPGDKIIIVSENRPEWFISDLSNLFTTLIVGISEKFWSYSIISFSNKFT